MRLVYERYCYIWRVSYGQYFKGYWSNKSHHCFCSLSLVLTSDSSNTIYFRENKSDSEAQNEEEKESNCYKINSLIYKYISSFFSQKSSILIFITKSYIFLSPSFIFQELDKTYRWDDKCRDYLSEVNHTINYFSRWDFFVA